MNSLEALDLIRFFLNYFVDIIGYITIISGFIFGVSGRARSWALAKFKGSEEIQNERIDGLEKSYGLLKAGVVALLHDRLYAEIPKLLDRDHITVEDYTNVQYLYQAYENLGGNGTCQQLWKRLELKQIKSKGKQND